MTEQELIQKAIEMQQFSYAPYSKFTVGAALLCEDGSVFTGCNVENAAYGCCICAERTALVKAITEGRKTGFVALAIAGQSEAYCWPCGSCRQMLCEFAPDLKILAVNQRGEYQKATLQELLPHFFGPHSLS